MVCNRPINDSGDNNTQTEDLKNNKLNTKRIITGDARPSKNIFPLECDTCDYKTNDPIEIGKHLSTHYTRTENRKRKCYYCGK